MQRQEVPADLSVGAASGRRTWSLAVVIVLVGLALRLAQYLRLDSLWGDEAMVALSIASRPFTELLPPLAYGQVATVPFLWAERLMVMLFGVNEWALRALPFMAGCGLCVAVVLLARRTLRPDEAIVAIVLTAFSQALVRYSAEVKSYSLDALLVVLLVGAAFALLGQMDNRRSWVLVALVGAAAIPSAFPSVFVCFGVGVALITQAFRQRRLDWLPRLGLLALFWATLFSLSYILLYRDPGNSPYMRAFWEGSFLRPGSPRLLDRFQAALVELARSIDAGWELLGMSVVTLGLVLVGTVTLWRRRGAPYPVLLLVPGLAPFAASALGIYPIATRLMLFAAPLFILLTAVGIMGAASTVNALMPPVRTRWVASILVFPAVITVLASMLYQRDQQMRPLVDSLRNRWRAGDAVYVFHRVVPAWLFYSTDWAAPNIEQLAWAMRVSGPGGLGHENGPPRGTRSPGEGEDLVYDLHGHPVLLGTSSGIQGRPMLGYLPRQPDPGWATNEARRIREAASSGAWLILGNASHEGLDLGVILLEAAKRAGGQVGFRDSVQDGRLYEIEF